MMKMAKLEGTTRAVHGSRAAQRLRAKGQLPAVIYGHGQPPAHVAVDRRNLANLVGHGSQVIELAVDGAPHSVLIKAVQFDPTGKTLVHADFMRVDLTERVQLPVPLEYRGTPAGTLEGGIFEEHLVDLEVETLVMEIPTSIRVNVADLKIGDFLHVRDIELPPGVKAVTPGETIVCTVRAKLTAEVEAAPAEEEPTQPEIITAKAKPEEEQEEPKK